MASHVESCYVSAGCNRAPHSLDWGYNNHICYASCRAVALYEPLFADGAGRLYATLDAHTDRVNCVRWVRSPSQGEETELISCSSDKTAILWKKSLDKFEVEHCLNGHSESVNVAEAFYHCATNAHPRLLIATASVDSTVKIWQKEGTEVNCVQTISCGSGFAFDLKFAILPGTAVPLLACAADDSTVWLFVEQESQFFKVHTLQGHEDWVRSLDFTTTDSGDLLLASAGQDSFIRLWGISSRDLKTIRKSITSEDALQNEDIKLKENLIYVQAEGQLYCFAVALEAIMAGHENWIYGIQWQPKHVKGGKSLRLLSASMDKTMILWAPSESGLWLEEVRVGEVGGNTLGFYGAKFSPDGTFIIAHGFHGAFHLWHFTKEQDSWLPQITVGGHFSEVHDIAWDPRGEFILSASLDQTTRLHGPWVYHNRQVINKVTWHELARPQVHGYDICCLAPISRYKFISGADEKVLRVFDAPRKFIENFTHLCGIDFNEELRCLGSCSLPEGASVPALSLSNKAIYEVERGDNQVNVEKEKEEGCTFIPVIMNEPPTEEMLLQSTLWPESHKLYGHGFEVFCVTCNHAGNLIASANKASKAEDAAILLWDVETWRQIGELFSHTLTITQLAFSPCDSFLLSVSRDRTWTVFQNQASDRGFSFVRIAYSDKKTSIHSRIIWTCSWTLDSKYFATGSRDKKVVVWGKTASDTSNCLGGYHAIGGSLGMPESVTSIDFSPVSFCDGYLLAIGTESGKISLHHWQTGTWSLLQEISKDLSHHLCVKRMKFRPMKGKAGNRSKDGDKCLQLATCGADFQVRVYNFYF